MSGKVALVGMSWIRSAEDYAALRKVIADPWTWPDTYDAWLTRAKEQEAKVKALGQTVFRVDLDPVEFPRWCAARKLNVDAQARRQFAAEGAMRRFERKDG